MTSETATERTTRRDIATEIPGRINSETIVERGRVLFPCFANVQHDSYLLK